MSRKRWVLLLKNDDTVDVYHITKTGKYQKRGALTHNHVIAPERVVEVVDEQAAADAWIHAVTSVLHRVLARQQIEGRVVYGVVDEHGEFFEPDMVTVVYMVKRMIDHMFIVMLEARANVA